MKNNVFPNMGCHDYTVLFTSILVYCHLDTAGASSLNNTCSPFPSPTHMPKKRRGKKSDPISTVETFPFEKRGMPSIFRNNSCQIDTNNSGRASYTLYYGRLSKCRLCRHDFLDFTPMGNQGFAASIPNNTWISLFSFFGGTSMETDRQRKEKHSSEISLSLDALMGKRKYLDDFESESRIVQALGLI